MFSESPARLLPTSLLESPSESSLKRVSPGGGGLPASWHLGGLQSPRAGLAAVEEVTAMPVVLMDGPIYIKGSYYA